MMFGPSGLAGWSGDAVGSVRLNVCRAESKPHTFFSEVKSCIFPLIDPSTYLGLGHGDKQGMPDIPFHHKALHLLLRDPEAFPGQMGYIIPPCGSALEYFSSQTCAEDPQKEASKSDFQADTAGSI